MITSASFSWVESWRVEEEVRGLGKTEKPLVEVISLMPSISDKGRFQIPDHAVPAKIVVALSANDKIVVLLGKPLLTSNQLAPLLIVTKIPILVPAKMFVPLNAKVYTRVLLGKFGNPL